MKKTARMKKPIYEKPRAISLSGVAQGACELGSAFIGGRCRAGLSAGGNCKSGNYADGDCRSGESVVGDCKTGTNP